MNGLDNSSCCLFNLPLRQCTVSEIVVLYVDDDKGMCHGVVIFDAVFVQVHTGAIGAEILAKRCLLLDNIAKAGVRIIECLHQRRRFEFFADTKALLIQFAQHGG